MELLSLLTQKKVIVFSIKGEYVSSIILGNQFDEKIELYYSRDNQYFLLKSS